MTQTDTNNPYAPPQKPVEHLMEEFAPANIFSSNGRIGRLRYIAYTIGIPLLAYLIFRAAIFTAGALTNKEMVAMVFLPFLSLPAMAFVFATNVLLTIQRCHDFNTNGWLSLVIVIPILPLIFWFIPGTKGNNRFGPPPPPNRGVLLKIVLLLILLFVIGILAAIAIPAYQSY
ncbi:MAG: DUF805 domain-containing protein [Candidatus Thiodiazotropha sp.]